MGIPDDRYGERVLAVVVTRSGPAVDLASVRAHFAADGVGRLNTPELVHVVHTLPRGPTGKVLRAALRDHWRTEQKG